MDELEPELRAAFGQLADGAEPSDALVGRTLARSTAIRRRRNAITASGVAAAVLVVTFAVAAAAGPNHPGSNFQVAGTGPGELSVSSTTVTTTTPSTTVPSTPATTRPRTAVNPVPVSTTTAPGCPQPATESAGAVLELEANGDITAVVSLPFGAGALLTPYTLDDGTTGSGGFRKEYTPAEFGPHWYETSSGGAAGVCSTRFTFDVSLSSLTTTTTGTTETSVPSDSTTVPETSTTIPG